jgi:hypothetical protein
VKFFWLVSLSRMIVDTLKGRWQPMGQKASSMSVLHLLGIAWLLHQLGNDEEACGFATMCLRKHLTNEK